MNVDSASMHGLTRMVGLCAAMLELPPSSGRDLALSHLQAMTSDLFGKDTFRKVFFSAHSMLSLNAHDIDILGMQKETRAFARELVAESDKELAGVLHEFATGPNFSEYLATTRALIDNHAARAELLGGIGDVDPEIFDIPELGAFDSIPDT